MKLRSAWMFAALVGCGDSGTPALEVVDATETAQVETVAEVEVEVIEVETRAEVEVEVETGTEVEVETEGEAVGDEVADDGDVGEVVEPASEVSEVIETADAEAEVEVEVEVTAEVEVGPEVSPGVSDDIYGVSVPRAESWWVEDGRIHHKDAVRRLRGINWFGLETPDRALHGTWFGRKVESFLTEIHGLGFDALRVPVSPETINPGFQAASWAQTAYQAGSAATGREQLERLIATATDFALLLDFHTCSPSQIGGSLPGRPDGCGGYDAEDWLADLTTLATLAKGHDHVVGIDLTNEPHALTWQQWKALVERGAEAVLRANPKLLVFVEGVAGASEFGGNYPFWGENLTEAASQTPVLPPSRLVFSPHVYGPGIANQSYFSAGNFPANMPAIWRTHFGHLVPSFGFAMGEFGGHYDDNRARGEVAWNEAFVDYLTTLDRGGPVSFFYWCVNANSGDTGGLYLNDWTTIDQKRVTLLAPLLAP